MPKLEVKNPLQASSANLASPKDWLSMAGYVAMALGAVAGGEWLISKVRGKGVPIPQVTNPIYSAPVAQPTEDFTTV